MSTSNRDHLKKSTKIKKQNKKISCFPSVKFTAATQTGTGMLSINSKANEMLLR